MSTTTPYEFLYRFRDNEFVQNQMIEKMAELAKLRKVSNFKKLFQDYVKAQKKAAGIVLAELLEGQRQIKASRYP